MSIRLGILLPSRDRHVSSILTLMWSIIRYSSSFYASPPTRLMKSMIKLTLSTFALLVYPSPICFLIKAMTICFCSISLKLLGIYVINSLSFWQKSAGSSSLNVTLSKS